MGTFYSKDPNSEKKLTLENFCKFLNDYPKGEGRVYIKLKKKENNNKYVFYEKELKKMISKYGCKTSQVKFVRDGISQVPEQAFFDFLIITQKLELSK